MIRIKEIPKSEVSEPYYLLVYEYMIGDADGDTSREVNVSIDNPYTERYIDLLCSLYDEDNIDFVVLNEEYLYDFYTENKISIEDYAFLCRMMGFQYDEPDYVFEVSPDNEKYANEFRDGVCSEIGYVGLSLDYVDLFYYDEHGTKYDTEIV